MPSGKMCGTDVSNKDSTPVTETKKQNKQNASRKDSNCSLSASTQPVDTDPPSPCKLCDHLVDDGKAIRCDNCSTWLHFKCSELTKAQYEWLVKPSCPSSIKWFCPVCETEPGKDPEDNKFDTLSALILTITKQNTEILKSMTNEKKVEKQIKVNLSEALEDQKEKDDRRQNLVFFNIPESADTDEGKSNDIGKVRDVIKHVCPDIATEDIHEQNVLRLGVRRASSDDHPRPKPRPIKIVFCDATHRDKVLKNARKLKDSKFQAVGISPDKTKKERDEYQQIRKEFRRRKDELNEDVVFYKGDIHLRSDEPWKRRSSGTSNAAEGDSEHSGSKL